MVYVLDYDETAAAATAAEFGAKSIGPDISSSRFVDVAVAQVVEETGRIDVPTMRAPKSGRIISVTSYTGLHGNVGQPTTLPPRPGSSGSRAPPPGNSRGSGSPSTLSRRKRRPTCLPRCRPRNAPNWFRRSPPLWPPPSASSTRVPESSSPRLSGCARVGGVTGLPGPATRGWTGNRPQSRAHQAQRDHAGEDVRQRQEGQHGRVVGQHPLTQPRRCR